MYHKRHEQETAELLRCLSLYQCLTYGQVMRLLPELKEDILSGLLTRLEHQADLLQPSDRYGYVVSGYGNKPGHAGWNMGAFGFSPAGFLPYC